MADTLPFAGPIKERAKEGIDRLLLAPVFLIYEIAAVLFPGVLFIILLFLKGNHSIVSAFQTTLLGYKTKLFIALMFSYLAGKVFIIPSSFASTLAAKRLTKYLEDPASKHMKEATNKFLLGMFILPEFLGAEHALSYLVIAITTASFYLSTGVVLLVSSLVPGDHNLRLIEAPMGALLCVCGYKGFDSCLQVGIAMIGVSFSGTIQKFFPGKMAAVLQIGLKLMSSKTGQEDTTSPGRAEQSPVATGGPQEPPGKTA